MKELAWEIGETSRMMRRFYDRRASALGVTTAQWRVIAHVRPLAWPSSRLNSPNGWTLSPSPACRIVDRLADAGLSNGSAIRGSPCRRCLMTSPADLPPLGIWPRKCPPKLLKASA